MSKIYTKDTYMAKAKTTKKDAPKITIDGKEYLIDELSDAAKQQIANLRVADAEIAKINNQRAMLMAARTYYANQLNKALEK
jgi:hypothetical protein